MSKVFGLDALGLLGYSDKTVSVLAAELPFGSALGVLIDKTFTKRYPSRQWLSPLYKVLDTGKVSHLTVDLLNATAVRNKVLQPYELLRGYTIASLDKACRTLDSKILRIINDQLDVLHDLHNRYPTVGMWPTLFLEHDLQRDSALTITNWAKSQSLFNVWVDNPLKPYTPLPGNIYTETHGNEPKSAHFISNDGASLWDADVELFKSRGRDLVEGWFHELNLNFTGGKTFVPPHKRTADPSRDQIRHAIRVIYNPPERKPLTLVPELKRPELWKVMAEDYKKPGDRRGSKPMFITKVKQDRIVIRHATTGKSVGYLGYYGTFSGTPGTHRYYIGKPHGSGETALSLCERIGTEWVVLDIKGGKKLVNLLRRSGYFR